MFIKVHPKKSPYILTVEETISRLSSIDLSKHSKTRPRPDMFLTETEVQSLREEMMRDGARMREWLSAKLNHTIIS